jgi:molybdopterin/thiamine biosynthesis adenylyltransferase
MNTVRWQDNPAFKNLYESEISLLQRGLGGDFELVGNIGVGPNGRVFCMGWLKISETQRMPIKIIFPTKYPYMQPLVLPLIENADGSIKDQPRMFGKGNQYANGAMCLMRKDQWDKDQHNTGWVLRRSQKWLRSALSPEGFKKEDIVEEIPSLIPHLGQVFLPKDVELPAELNSGIIVLTQFKPNYYILEQNVVSEPPFALDLGKEAFKWFRIKGKTFKEIFNNNFAVLLQNLQRFGIRQDDVVGKNLALFIEDDPNPWHFFKFPVNLNQMQVVYLLSRNIEKELYHRTRDIFDEQVLKQKTVTIIGLGALGSEVARSLARNGVGHFNLFDDDVFEIGNSVRHAADLFFIGENKTDVSKQLILRSNPNIIVNAFPINILDDIGLLEQCLSHTDLCIVLTAENSVDYLINDHYVSQFDIPFVFARVSAGGLSGSVQVVKASETACLRCLSLYGADTLPVPEQSKRFEELPPEYGSCSSPAVAGSEIDTKEIALQVSRVAMQLLLNHSTYAPRKGDQYYWHGPFGSKEIEAFTWEFSKLEKHKECAYCNL